MHVKRGEHDFFEGVHSKPVPYPPLDVIISLTHDLGLMRNNGMSFSPLSYQDIYYYNEVNAGCNITPLEAKLILHYSRQYVNYHAKYDGNDVLYSAPAIDSEIQGESTWQT